MSAISELDAPNYDDHLGLKHRLSPDVLAKSLSEIGGVANDDLQEVAKELLVHANKIIDIVERPQPESGEEKD